MRSTRCVFIAVTLLSLCFLSMAACTDSNESSSIISIASGVETIGSNGDSTEQQTLTFSWQLKNNTSKEVLLQWIQPNLSDILDGRLLTADARVNVGKIINPGETIEVDGAITFDATGLSKQEIIEKCYITDVTVSTEFKTNMIGNKGN